MVLGQIVLDAMGISLASYQVAGGIVLFLFALQMVFDPHHNREDADQSPGPDVAIFPLAIPSIAGPAAMMAVVMLTDNIAFNVMEQVETSVAMLCRSRAHAAADARREPDPAADRRGRGEHRAARHGADPGGAGGADGGGWIKQLAGHAWDDPHAEARPDPRGTPVARQFVARRRHDLPVGRIRTSKGEILFYLYPQTPNHEASFIKLAKRTTGIR